MYFVFFVSLAPIQPAAKNLCAFTIRTYFSIWLGKPHCVLPDKCSLVAIQFKFTNWKNKINQLTPILLCMYVFQKGFAYTVLCWSWRRGYFLHRVVGSALLFLWMRLLFLFHIRHTMFIFIHNISLCKSNCEMDMKSCFLFLLNQKILQKAWNLIT